MGARGNQRTGGWWTGFFLLTLCCRVDAGHNYDKWDDGTAINSDHYTCCKNVGQCGPYNVNCNRGHSCWEHVICCNEEIVQIYAPFVGSISVKVDRPGSGRGISSYYAGSYRTITCSTCSAGKFSTWNRNHFWDGQFICQDCPQGKTSSSGSDLCTNCAENTYNSFAGSTFCDLCPKNSGTIGTGHTAISSCVCNAGYHGPDGGTCNVCGGNLYKEGKGGSCSTCPTNSGHDLTAQTAKTSCACNAGYYGPDGGTCTLCGKNVYKPARGSTCTDTCPANSGHDLEGQTNANNCACNAGYEGQNGGTCNQCPKNTYKSARGDSCTTCPPNSHHSLTGQTSVTACRCKPGYISASGGATANSDCVPCARGKYTEFQIDGVAPVSGASECFTNQHFCRNHRYCNNNAIDNSICTCCSGQFMQIVDGIRRCEKCPHGKYMDAVLHYEDRCRTCVTGSYPTTLELAATADAKVPVEFGLEGHGAIECVGALAATQCNRCPVGTYKSQAGYGLCQDCWRGQYSASAAANACDDCLPGKYSDAYGVSFLGANAEAKLTCGGTNCAFVCPDAPFSRYGQISDGGSLYKNNADCWWMLETSQGFGIEVVFEEFYTEIERDFMSVYECDSSSCSSQKLLWKEAGFLDARTAIMSRKKIMKLIFKSDSAIQYKGFKGTWSVVSFASTSCDNCAAGKYTNLKTQATCIDCNAGMYSGKPGETACENCVPGKYAEVTGVSKCTDCAAGKYSGRNASMSALDCAQCPESSFTYTTGNTQLSNCLCNAGFSGLPGNCSQCTPGKYKDVLGPICSTCDAGKFFNGHGATKCGTCVAGKFKNDATRNSITITGNMLYSAYVAGTYYWHSTDANELPVYERRRAWGEVSAYLYYSVASGYWHLYWKHDMDTAALYYAASSIQDPESLTGDSWREAREDDFYPVTLSINTSIDHECYNCAAGEYSSDGAASCESCPAGAFSVPLWTPPVVDLRDRLSECVDDHDWSLTTGKREPFNGINYLPRIVEGGSTQNNECYYYKDSFVDHKYCYADFVQDHNLSVGPLPTCTTCCRSCHQDCMKNGWELPPLSPLPPVLRTAECTTCEAGKYKATVGLHQPAYILFSYSGAHEELAIDLRYGEGLEDSTRMAPSAGDQNPWSGVLFVNVSLVLPPDPFGCREWNNTAGRGRIALIKRGGDCGFGEKIWHAERSGASAVVIFNDRRQSSFRFQVYELEFQHNITVPAGMIHQELGEELARRVHTSGVEVTAPSYCRVCPGNSTSADGSGALTSCVCNAGYVGPAGGPCALPVPTTISTTPIPTTTSTIPEPTTTSSTTPTPTTTSSTTPAPTSTTPEPTTTSSTTPAMTTTPPPPTVCRAGTAGTYTTSGGVNCTACAAGTFAAYDNASACHNCSAGMFKADAGWPSISIGKGEAMCWPYLEGTYYLEFLDSDGLPVYRKKRQKWEDIEAYLYHSPSSGFWHLYWRLEMDTAAVFCENYGIETAAQLHECVWYAACDGEWKQSSVRPKASTNHECYPCMAGEYAATGASTCSSCAAGAFSLDSSFFRPGASSCTLCEAGKYKPTAGLNQPTYVLFSLPDGHYELPFDFSFGENMPGERFAPAIDHSEYWSRIEPASRPLVVSSDPYGCSEWQRPLAGKIALVKRGVCGFSDKMWYAMRAKALAVIFYNNRAESSFRYPLLTSKNVPSIQNITIPGGMIHQTLGEILAGVSANVTIPSYCRACPGNTTSAPGSGTLASCVCKEGYTGPPGGPCLLQARAPPGPRNVTFWHDCSGKYDCARGEYVPVIAAKKNYTVWHDCSQRYECHRGDYAGIPPARKDVCEDEEGWSLNLTGYETITCKNYASDPQFKSYCYQDHFDLLFTAYSTPVLVKACSTCCKTCYQECCIEKGLCLGNISHTTPSSTSIVYSPTSTTPSPASIVPSPTSLMPSPTSTTPSPASIAPSPTSTTPSPASIAPSPTSTTPSPSSTTPSPPGTTPTPTFWHDCSQKYDCVRGEYVPKFPVTPASTTPSPPGTTPTPTFWHDCSQKYDCARGEYVPKFPITPASTTPAPTTESNRTAFLEFASSGTQDDARSCRAQCTQGYYRLFDLENEICRRHSVLVCRDGQWLRNGTHARDAQCEPCSGCEGRRLVAHCSTYADTVCEDCGKSGERQRWAGDACTPACDDGFVWNIRTQECDFCGTYEWRGGKDGSWRKGRMRCPPGYQSPVRPDNCTHCVECKGLPENAVWSAQDDREDCVWLCQDAYQLQASEAGERCVPREGVEAVPTMTKVDIECDPGSIPVDFACKSCFEAGELGQAGVILSSLPLKADENLTWSWLYACRWQCMHEDDLWEIQSASGQYWECKSVSQRDGLLEAGDLSWIDTAMRRSAPSIDAASSQAAAASITDSTRAAEQQVAGSMLVQTVAVMGSLPVMLVLCALVAGCAMRCRSRKYIESEENETLLEHDHRM